MPACHHLTIGGPTSSIIASSLVRKNQNAKEVFSSNPFLVFTIPTNHLFYRKFISFILLSPICELYGLSCELHEDTEKEVLMCLTWRTLAYQEVRLRIPLAKLGRLKSSTENFLVYISAISLASGPIRSFTSWYAKVLHVPDII